MFASEEVLANAGLVIIKQGIDAGLARDFSAECAALVVSDVILPTEKFQTSPNHTENLVHSYVYRPRVFAGTGFVAIQKVLELNPYRDRRDATIAINRQNPHAEQSFHSDSRVDEQVVVHGSDGGLFDFSLTDDPYDYHTVEVNAGYVVEQHHPDILHRGRNPSDAVRYTAVLGIEDPVPLV